MRRQIVGVDARMQTPFGERILLYCDYTASGRCLRFVEDYIQQLEVWYANSHTEDDLSGKIATQLLHDAEAKIKESVNAGASGKVVAVGTGATGAIDKLQQIIGVSLCPATRARLMQSEISLDTKSINTPVVFVGPYEHHSNEVMWRHSLAEVIRIGLDNKGGLDMRRLEELLRSSEYSGRLKVGSFSVASNVTGVKADAYELACLLHSYDALVCFDYAAAAPYLDINMNPEAKREGDDPSVDAIYISTHKFLGGPGSSGLLVFNQRIYPKELPPTVCAGGTVDYVGFDDEDFIADIEEREKGGTPGILQMVKAGLVFELKHKIGVSTIEEREQRYLKQMFSAFENNSRIEILGPKDPNSRIGIVSFNLKSSDGKYLHHRLVSKLLNDLFGIQSRAGCSCAGPYGHELLKIDSATSNAYRKIVAQGYVGMKPGWCRISAHWVLDDIDMNYIIDAISFLAENGDLFLRDYRFNPSTGVWKHLNEVSMDIRLSIDDAISMRPSLPSALSDRDRKASYSMYLEEAKALATKLQKKGLRLKTELPDACEELRFFS